MNDEFEVPLSLFPLISISTLSTLVSQKDATAYQIALLVCMLLAHSLASTDVSKITAAENQLLCNVTISISYGPLFLSIMDTFLNRTAFFSVFSPRLRAAPLPAGSRKFKFKDHFKLWFRSLIPTFLILTYASLIMIKISIGSFQERLKYQAAIFAFSWIFFVELYYWRRKHFLGVAGSGSVGTSTIMSIATSAHLTDHDERNWERWNTHQFLNWTKHKYIEINNGDELDEDDLGNLLMTIQSQRINGSSIPYLGIQEFRSMGISHGNAVMLFHSLSVLMQRYNSSKTQAYRLSNSDAGAGESQNYHQGIDLDAWLGKKIGQPPKRNDDSDDDEENNIQPPTPKDQSDIQESNSGHHSNYPNVDALGAAPQAAHGNGFGIGMASASASASTEIQFDESLLSAMPPSVRDIAARRPELVQALLAKKQQSMSIPEVTAKAGLYPIDEEACSVDGDDNGCEELEENVDTDWDSGGFNPTEMMGLLRRRGKKD